MTALLYAVGTGLLATLLWWMGSRLVRAWQQARLRRFVRVQRKRLRRRLAARVTLNGGRFSRRQAHLLASTFRLRRDSQPSDPHDPEETFDAPRFLTYLEGQGQGSIVLINADTGYGKTILAMTLPLLRSPLSRRSLLPVYVDLAEADEKNPLAGLKELLTKLGDEHRLWGRPLILLDALNETVDAELFAESLARRKESLTRVRAQLVFLFSFRHRSYPSRLRSALEARGFGHLQGVELLFDPDKSTDLGFFPELLRDAGSAPSLRSLAGDVRSYSERFPTAPLSREEVSVYLKWRYLPSADTESGTAESSREPGCAPSPAYLSLQETLTAARGGRDSILVLAKVAFLLLGDESTALYYREIAARAAISEERMRGAVADSGLADLLRCQRFHLRFVDETTVRVCGAIEVAWQLSQGKSPTALCGRTTYDTCAPYVIPAIRWLQSAGFCPDVPIDRFEQAVLGALSGRAGPYSFYAGVLCGERGTLPSEVEDRLDAGLFEAMIEAIDDDRGQTCAESLRAAGKSESEVLDPVLDQLFEVMATYGRRAVPLLLEISTDPSPLIRSQAVYLLLDWIGRASVDPTPADAEQLASIATGLVAEEANLHVRFHLVEVLERLVFVAEKETTRRQAAAKLTQLVAAPNEPGGGKVYSVYQDLLCLRATSAAEGNRASIRETEIHSHSLQAAALIALDGKFWCRDGGPLSEEQLECWEVALAMCAYAAETRRRNSEHIAFVKAALDHEYWVVRWWAFNALASILRSSVRAQDGVLARMCAERLVTQLCTAVEPMGLKHRQCAVLMGLRRDGTEAGAITRTVLATAAIPQLGTPAGQKFAERYYEVMGASPDHYMAEFSRRLDDLAPMTG